MHKRPVWAISFLLLAVTLGVYSPVLTHSFLDYDDDAYVTRNTVVQQGLTLDGWRWAWTTFHASNWHPLTWLSHMLDCQVFQLTPAGHHFTNVLFHLANTLLVFLVLRRMTGATWRPALVAALFALHPLHVESVAWVAERKDVLSTFFGLLALAAYAEYVRHPRPIWYALLLAAFALSLLAKPMLITLPAVLLLLDYWPLRRFQAAVAGGQPRSGDEPAPRPPSILLLLLEKAPLLALSVASGVVTVLAQSDIALVSLQRIPLSGRAANALTAYAGYLRKTVWPSDLAIFYPHTGSQVPWLSVLLAVVVLAVLTALAVGWRRRRPALLVGWLWFLGTLVPVIGLAQVGLQSMADRYTYFPLIGIFLALAWCIPERWGTQTWPRVGLAVGVGGILTACVVVTWFQLSTWQDERTVWDHALRVTENNAVAHFSLGTYLYNHGRREEGADHLRQAAELDPENALILHNLGRIRLEQGKDDEALDLLTRAAAQAPAVAVYHNSLGVALVRKGRLEEAGRAFGEAIRLAPDMAEPYFNLAITQEDQSHAALTTKEREDCLSAAKNNYVAGLQRDPNWPKNWAYPRAENLLHTDDEAFRCPAEALWRARQADAATVGRDPEIQALLAEALAANGRMTEAVAVARSALAGAGPGANLDFVLGLQGALRRYQAALAKQTNPSRTP